MGDPGGGDHEDEGVTEQLSLVCDTERGGESGATPVGRRLESGPKAACVVLRLQGP